ncbi:MAG: chromate transporter [Bacteroidales bacterium]|nr:chromate transporter [Bacteroidales bacterium]
MIYLQLFWVFFKIGLFGFGGGYAMISLIRMDVVDEYQWMSAAEFADLIAISQMTPGPISINTATFVGFTEAGVLGSIVASVSLCLPSILLMLLVLRLFFKHKDSEYVKHPMAYMLPVVAGLIIAAGILMFDRETFSSWLSFVIFGGTVAVQLLCKKISPILLIVIAGILGWGWGMI